MTIDSEHYTGSDCCWCNPKVKVLDNGNKIIIHNDISPEEARMHITIDTALLIDLVLSILFLLFAISFYNAVKG